MTLEWLSAVLEKKFGVKPTIGTAGPISEGSHGYMAQIQRVQLEWPVERDDLPKTVVIKCPVAGSAADAWMEASGGDLAAEEKAAAAAAAAENMKKVQEMCHGIESQIYGIFDESYPAPCPMPKTYATFGLKDEHPSIIMEDITGATVYDIVDGWTEKQLRTIIDGIVGLHVMSYTSTKWNTVTYEKDEQLAHSLIQMADIFATEILKRTPLPCLEKVQTHLLKTPDWLLGEHGRFENNPLAVMVHGDMWAPQFLWRGDELAAIVDWQLTHPGSTMEDFLRLMTLGCSTSERARLTPILLQYYYDQLTARLAEKGKDTPFTFDQLKEEYKISLNHASGMAVFAFSMWSNSPVLKRGLPDDDARIGEIFSRVVSLLEECVEANGW